MKTGRETRRSFIGSLAGAGAWAALSGCVGPRADVGWKAPQDFKWAFLVHFGMNMWNDIISAPERDDYQNILLTDEEFAEIAAHDYGSCYNYCDYVRFDETLWREFADRLKASGCNTLIVDLGEFVRFPSHPELAVKGSWEPARMNAEIRRLKAMGFDVIPKLNFSTCHDTWLKEYSWMVSTERYHQVCADVIRDACEICDRPSAFHLGLDEEDIVGFQSKQQIIIMRQGERWWKDVHRLIGNVEKQGARAWMWSDWAFHNDVDEFIRRIPKATMQCPWTYGLTDKYLYDEKKIRVMDRLGEAGLDIVPAGSNCFGCLGNFHALTEHAAQNIPPDHFKGMLMTTWMQTRSPYRRLLDQAADLMAEEVRRTKG